MPAYEKCVKHDGKIYCWNSETDQIEEITARPVGITECPEIVVFDLLRLLGKAAAQNGKA